MASVLAKKLIGEAQGDPPGPLHDPDQELMRDVVNRAVRPHIVVTFLDNGEVLDIPLVQSGNAFWHGSEPKQGLVPAPTTDQLLRFCLHPEMCQGIDQWKRAGELCVDSIKSLRYEDEKFDGEFGSYTGATNSGYMAHRAFKSQWKNDPSAPDAMRRNESEDDKFMRGLVRKALEPLLVIKFLDEGGETIHIRLKWTKEGYLHASNMEPGLLPCPTSAQLKQIGGRIGGVSGGQYAMERIYCDRYEGQESNGTMNTDPNDQAECARETPSMWFRPIQWAYVNDGEPPDSMYK